MSPKTCLLCLIMIVWSASLYGQEFRIISFSGEGYKTTPPDTSKLSLQPGSRLSVNDVLVLKSGKIKLLNRDKPLIIEEEGTYPIEALYAKNSMKSMSFTSRFWNFVVEGLQNSDSKTDLQSYHAANLSISGGIKGYATGTCSEDSVSVSSPLSGNHGKRDIEMIWTSSVSPQIKVMDMSNQTTFWTGVGEDGRLSLPAEEWAGNIREDKVKVVFQFEGCTVEKHLTIADPDQEVIDLKIASVAGLEKENGQTFPWAEAVVLEMQGYPNEAYQAYQQLLKDNADDPLLERLYYLFQVRNNPDFILSNKKQSTK